MNFRLKELSIVLAVGVSLGLSGGIAQASSENNAAAQYSCEDCEGEVWRLIRLSRGGSGDASALVAMAYASGEGMEQNHERAAHFIERGVRQGSAVALFIKSDWYERGYVVENNEQKAASYLKRAADMHYPPAAYKLAAALLSKKDADHEYATSLLIHAANKTHVESMFLLARLLHTGTVVEQDLKEAADLYARAVLGGHNNARSYLREITAVLAAEASDEQQKAYVNELEQVQNIERIQVTGQRFSIDNSLSVAIRRLEATGMYDTRSIGSRIRGVSCEQSGQNCSVQRAEGSGAMSLSDLIQGVTN